MSPLARSSMSRVLFAAGGRALLDGVEVPMTTEGLVVDDERRLALAVVPAWPDLPPAAGGVAPTSRPGALAVWRGRAYFVSADGRQVRVRDCDGGVSSFAEAAGPGPGWVEPEVTSLAVTPDDTLLVVDRGRGSVRELDLLTGRAVWSWTGIAGVDDVTVSPQGRRWASCTRGIVRLDRDGPVVLARRTGPSARPTSLAWARVDGDDVLFVALGTRVLVLDLATGSITRGKWSRLLPGLAPPMALRWSQDRLHVASPSSTAATVVDTTSQSLLGGLAGTPRPFSGFGVGDATVWMSDGETARSSVGTESVPVGTAVVGPVPIVLDRATAHTLRLRMVGLPTGSDAGVVASFAGAAPGTAARGPDLVVEVPPSAAEVRVGLALRAGAPGTTSARPVLGAVDLVVDPAGWIDQLPAIYRDAGNRPEQFLEPFLHLTRSALDDVVDALRALPDQIDPSTSYDDRGGERWLDWLAGWVDVRLGETMSRRLRRILVSGAFRRHGTRGTARHLEEVLGLEAGLDDVTISHPGDAASVWVLGAATAELGQRTMTAAASPDGSVLDVSAVADRSHLTGSADFGAALFGDVAHRFDVLVHAAHLRCPEDRDRVVALIERERPAHSHAHLCVIEPGISVGIQSRIGIDTVIGETRDGIGLALT
jgi:phage tail-like protein